MAKGLAAALAALTALMLIPAAAPAKRIAGVNVKPGCDFIGTGACQFPWPNDYFTKRDRTHRHRSPPGAREVRDAAQQERQADRPDAT